MHVCSVYFCMIPVYLVVSLFVLDSENKTHEQPTESRKLDMNPDDYAKLYVISDCSNGYHRAYELV